MQTLKKRVAIVPTIQNKAEKNQQLLNMREKECSKNTTIVNKKTHSSYKIASFSYSHKSQ
jgi:hypothetical protein